jgi:CRP-like cAMP-binding protein
MFDEPLLGHPAETGGVYATWQPHSPDDDRDQHYDDADDERHMVLAVITSSLGVSRSLHVCRRLSVRLCTPRRARELSRATLQPPTLPAGWLHEHPEFSDWFLAHMVTRNIRIEEDLVDQLFNSSEKRLARMLLLLARYGKEDTPRVLPKLSQETLAEMVVTTRSRVNFFMNKFRKLGLIEYNGGLKVNSSVLSIVLHD